MSGSNSQLTDLVAIPVNINASLSSVSNQLLLSLLGSPAKQYLTTCSPVTNQQLLTRIKWGVNVGPFKVSGFDLAVESLKDIMYDINASYPHIFNEMESVGMLCCRLVRNGNTISNHSWGTAVDIKISGNLDEPGNNKVQYGLTEIAPVFNDHGWFWGAGFNRWEDGMHFEVSKEKLLEWHRNGLLFSGKSLPSLEVLRLGSRSEKVRELQEHLNKIGFDLDVDGLFGIATDAAVIAFQSEHCLEADGIVGKITQQAIINALS